MLTLITNVKVNCNDILILVKLMGKSQTFRKTILVVRQKVKKIHTKRKML